MNQQAPHRQGDEVRQPYRQERRQGVAFAQGFQEGHDGIVHEDDDHRQTKSHRGRGALFLYPQRSANNGKNKASHREGEPAIDFHLDAGHVGMGRFIGFLGNQEFPDSHFIQFLLFFRNIFRCHSVRNFLAFEVKHPVYAVAGEVINDPIGHMPYAIFPYCLRRIFHPNGFFVFKFLDGDIFQFFGLRVVATSIEQVVDFPVLHIPDDHMVGHARIQIFSNFRVQHVVIFPVGPRHHVFIESHSTKANQ